MKLRRPAVRPPPETIIALIDVVFFLLIFFMLIGRMDATAPFVVAPPIATSGADMPAGGVTVSVAADGALALDGLPITEAGLLSVISLTPAETLVRINADAQVELRHILPLVDKLEAEGLENVALVVTPEGA